jgi:hypothetical protein
MEILVTLQLFPEEVADLSEYIHVTLRDQEILWLLGEQVQLIQVLGEAVGWQYTIRRLNTGLVNLMPKEEQVLQVTEGQAQCI